MIVDSSAALAVLLNEPERDEFRAAIADANRCVMSSISYLESAIALAVRRGEASFAELDAWIEAYGIEIASFTAEHARIARRAFTIYGKGNHPAGLNFGDCATYALAIAEDQPLLYKGDDFSQTNLRPAL